jgi:hypothetical protein
MMTIRITISCLIALLCSSITPAASEPFNILVGCWKGKGDFYSPDGVHQGSVCSRGATYWKTRPTLMHFREEQQACSNEVLQDTTKKVIAALSILEYDLPVDNTSLSGGCSNCGGSGINIHVIGTETPTDVYHFQLNFQNSGNDGNWYNNHYFTGRNTRHVLGFFEPAGHLGEIDYVAAQTLKRVPCTSKDDKRER